MAGKRLHINCKVSQKVTGTVRNAFDCKLQNTLLTVASANREFILLPQKADQGRRFTAKTCLNHFVGALSIFPLHHLSGCLLSMWAQDGCCTSRHDAQVSGRKKREWSASLSFLKSFPRNSIQRPPFTSHWSEFCQVVILNWVSR